MTADRNKLTDEKLAAYVDGALPPDEHRAIEAVIANDPMAQAAVERYRQIDASLRRQMQFGSLTESNLEAMLSSTPPSDEAVAIDKATVEPKSVDRTVSKRRLALLAVAASVAWILVSWQISQRDRIKIAFQPRPLAEIYRETVDKGFEPYYECREPKRFAQTFLTRQGQALHLLDMPRDRYMLGLSYPGGLSRQTTAMLCRVEDQPVMVFVDRIVNDVPNIAESSGPGIEIFREERNGLVFYEVTPVPAKRVTEFLSPSQG